MKRVFFSSADAIDSNLNLSKYIAIAKWAVYECGMVPIMPHFNSLILDLSTEKGAIKGMLASKDMVFYANEMWVIGNDIDERVEREIQLAKILKIKIKYISENEMNKMIEKYGGITINVEKVK